MKYKFRKDFVVVKTNKRLKYEISRKDNIKILVDPEFNPERHVHNQGEVISVPDELSSTIPYATNALGPPWYHNMYSKEVVWLNALPMTISQGDTVFYHHNIPLDNESILKETHFPDGTSEYILKILYSQIFCTKREEGYYPHNTFVMLTPEVETMDDILVPVVKLDEFGHAMFEYKSKLNAQGIMQTVKVPVYLPKDKWIMSKSTPGDKPLTGFIKHIGEPLINGICDLKEGDHVVYRSDANFEVFIEDNRFFMTRQRHIQGIIRPD